MNKDALREQLVKNLLLSYYRSISDNNPLCYTCPMKEALLFDLDGTILYTAEANYLAYNSALGEFGKMIPRAEFENLLGRDSREFLPEIFPSLISDQIELIREIKQERYRKFFSEVHVNEFLIELIKANDDKVICLVTNGKSKNTLEVLEHFRIKNFFHHIITGDFVEVGKPNSAVYIRALEIINLRPDQALAFEDSPEGIRSATNAGIKVVKIPKFVKN
jgi:HAD superfamily hydrolase (TIGR01509 family)